MLGIENSAEFHTGDWTRIGNPHIHVYDLPVISMFSVITPWLVKLDGFNLNIEPK